jgi:hypothetical protein
MKKNVVFFMVLCFTKNVIAMGEGVVISCPVLHAMGHASTLAQLDRRTDEERTLLSQKRLTDSDLAGLPKQLKEMLKRLDEVANTPGLEFPLFTEAVQSNAFRKKYALGLLCSGIYFEDMKDGGSVEVVPCSGNFTQIMQNPQDVDTFLGALEKVRATKVGVNNILRKIFHEAILDPSKQWLIDHLVARGFPIDEPFMEYGSPLAIYPAAAVHVAISYGKSEMLEHVLNLGADANGRDHSLYCSLLSGVRHRLAECKGEQSELVARKKIVELLEKYTASKLKETEQKFLNAAAQGDLVAVKKFNDEGCSKYLRDENGNTALMLAIKNGHDKVAEFLWHSDSSLYVNNDGKTACDLAKDVATK